MSATGFRLAGELPRGVTVLEASAGTGKTYTIAALATRYVADGIPLQRLLLVTFTRVATGELRKRVRDRFVQTEAQLARVLAGAEPEHDDEVTLLLCDGPDPAERDLELVAIRRERLSAAISDFDGATIETTHGFCQKVLDELGTLADIEPDIEFVDNVDDLIREVVDDLYVRAFHRRDENDPVKLRRQDAQQIAALAINNPQAVIHPQVPADPNQTARVRLAAAARAEFEQRKRRLGLMTHDDQLTRLLATLQGPSGPAAIASLRERFSVVLIDEFQDTDPLQWEIVRLAFVGGQTTLVLIGDPKQAIYAFRGADVYAYLDAARSAGNRATLDVNRRSDAPLLSAFDALFGGAHLGEDEIVYRTVSAARGHEHSALHDAPVPAPLRVRILDRSDPAVALTGSGAASASEAQALVAADLARDVVRLLGAGARIDRDRRPGAAEPTPVEPGDVAVLVRSRWQAGLVQQALQELAVPAVIAGAGSVFETRAAQDWLTLLQALERPASGPRARAAALTPFLGYSATDLALAGEQELELLHRTLHVWARVLREHGVAALTQTIIHGQQVPGRLLALIDGERQLTDVQHIAELLHAAGTQEQLGVAAMTSWLRQRIDAAGEEGSDERARRLDSDDDAVQVLTFHRSKGLEFPIIYCPFLWGHSAPDKRRRPFYFHDPAAGGRRAIDVSAGGAGFEEHHRRYVTEEDGEDLRLLYVALTRARHQAVLWWAGSYYGKDSALTRLLLSKQLDGSVGPGPKKTPTDEQVTERLAQISDAAPGCVSVERVSFLPEPPFAQALRAADGLRAAEFSRSLDLHWRRTSYSAITSAAHDQQVASEPDSHGITDEPDAPEQQPTGAAASAAEDPEGLQELMLAAMAAGPRLGTLIHTVMEEADFTAQDLETELATVLAARTRSSPQLLGCPVDQAASGLARALRTPLGGDLGALALTSIPRGDRLDELVFELPLAGGENAVGTATLEQVAELLENHLSADDPLAGYAARLRDPLLSGVMRGYLTGSIDLVLRTGDSGDQRYVIVDYKTNWLAGSGEALKHSDYLPARLAREMQTTHYALQALLYSVALHRFLRWRLAGYDPERHLGGVRYLFLRGMSGPGSSTGVFGWHPLAKLICDLSDLLNGNA